MRRTGLCGFLLRGAALFLLRVLSPVEEFHIIAVS
jgi:hypothetical protein